jgi:hypothetical protein
MITVAPPAKGPSIIPMRGARASEREKEDERPIIGPMGIILKTA